MRILILTNGPLCRNPRTLKEATTLGSAGMKVTVVGISNHRGSVAIDADLGATPLFRHESLEILPGYGPAAFTRRMALRFWRELAHRSGWQTIHSLGPAHALLARARRHPADLTIVHNEIAHWAGLKLQAEGRRIAADLEDWHSEDLLPTDRRARPLALLRHIESRLLQSCDYCTTTSHTLADALHARYRGRKPHVISNSFPLQPNPRTSCVSPSPVLRFFWFSQTLGPGRGLEEFMAAWARLSQPTMVTLLGEDRSGYRRKLLAAVPERLRPQMAFLPLLPPTELPAEIARHDIGLALEDPRIPSRDLTITNKILQYLNAGLAVAASATAGQREVLAQQPDAGCLLSLAAPEEMVQTLEAFTRSEGRLQQHQLAARRLAESTYCWEQEAPRLLALVRRVFR